MSQLDIFMDISTALEKSFFDADLHRRLLALGTLRRGLHHDDGRDERMAAEVLITGWGSELLPQHLDSGDRLRFAVHSAGTVRQIVPKSLIEDGLQVSQAAGGMATSVAELALVFTISLLRNLHVSVREMSVNNDWVAAAAIPTGYALSGTRVGVIGASRVGKAYIDLVTSAGATVSVYDPYLSSEVAAQLGVTLLEIDELLKTCRVIALHAPVTPETRNLLDRGRIGLIADGSVVVNTARSAIVDMSALVDELTNGRLSAGLDVFDDEPLPKTSPLWGLPNVMLTPHIGGTTLHAQHLQGLLVVEEMERFAAGQPLGCEISAARYDSLA